VPKQIVVQLLFFFQAEDGIRDFHVTGVQTCALPISVHDSLRALGIPPVKPPKKDRRTKGEETAVLLLSDWQLGKRTPTYSSEVRSEERRVGKGWRTRWSRSTSKVIDGKESYWLC